MLPVYLYLHTTVTSTTNWDHYFISSHINLQVNMIYIHPYASSVTESALQDVKYSYHQTQGNKEILGGVGCAFYLDYGDGIVSVCICPRSSNRVLKLYGS